VNNFTFPAGILNLSASTHFLSYTGKETLDRTGRSGRGPFSAEVMLALPTLPVTRPGLSVTPPFLPHSLFTQLAQDSQYPGGQ